MKIGRRKSMILSAAIGMVGISLTLVVNFYVFNLGRFIYGFANGT